MTTTSQLPGSHPVVDAPPWRALPVLLAGTFLIVLDFFIVNVALPSMQVQLGASPAALEWVVAGYGLSFAALLMVAGQLGDRWGRRRLFVIGVTLFTVASALCGAAPDPAVLVAARVAQGATAALVGPTVLAIIGTLFQGPDRARAIGAYAMSMGVAAVGGQLIGGLLLAADVAGSGWRSIFLINIPIGVTAALLARRWVPRDVSRDDASRDPVAAAGRIDVTGLVLISTALTALVLPLLEGRQQGRADWTWACLLAAPVLLLGFVLRQRRLLRQGRRPLLDPGLFRSRGFGVGMLAQLVLWCGQASYFLVLALFLQQGLRLSPPAAGGVFTVLAVAYLATSLLAPRLAARWGRYVVTLGAALLAAGHLGLLAEVTVGGTDVAVAALAPGLLLAGAGMGLCITALTGTVLATADPRTAGAVSALLSTVQQVGNAIGVAVIGVVFFGAVGTGIGSAFGLSLEVLVGFPVALAALSLLLPAGRRE